MRSAGIQRTYTTSAGEMTLNMDLLDSGSNSLVGRVIDERRDMDTGRLEFTNAVTNQQAARVMYRAWAKQLGIFDPSLGGDPVLRRHGNNFHEKQAAREERNSCIRGRSRMLAAGRRLRARER